VVLFYLVDIPISQDMKPNFYKQPIDPILKKFFNVQILISKEHLSRELLSERFNFRLVLCKVLEIPLKCRRCKLPAGHLCGRFYPRTWTHEWLADWMSDWLTGSLNDWLTDRINDWLTDGHATIAATTNILAEKGERWGGDQLFPYQVLCLPNLCSPSPPFKWGRSRVGLAWDGMGSDGLEEMCTGWLPWAATTAKCY